MIVYDTPSERNRKTEWDPEIGCLHRWARCNGYIICKRCLTKRVAQ